MRVKKTIRVEGTIYPVVESLGYQAGYRTLLVEDNGAERVVVWRNGEWQFWTAADRLGRRMAVQP